MAIFHQPYSPPLDRIFQSSKSMSIRPLSLFDIQIHVAGIERNSIVRDGRSTTDIKRRIAQAKEAFMRKKPLLCLKNLRLQTRKQFLKTFVETWCWRRMLKIKWTDRVRNEEVYRRIERAKYINIIKKDIGKKRYQDVVGVEREEWKTAVDQSTD
ncbi:hypothetical protein J437_LFUL012098 [Ladona fulva]|uniref:Endonuclease-reverse transcriptase n=1 Tax=Ladona fulva TaxID=123851 RepID=A0A8K0JY77_LADFU|nr:hypothetical protein J437_LFUL012098 [Ladona fulva]